MSPTERLADPKAAIAIVTGAAAGIGAAVAQRFSLDGWPLLLCDLNAEQLTQAAKHLGTQTPVELLSGDISANDFPARLLSAISDRKIGAFIHCAGISASMGDPAHVLEVNLAATLRLIEALRPHLGQGSSTVLLASSAGHLMGSRLDATIGAVTTSEAVGTLFEYAPRTQVAYCISKRGVQLLAKREAKAFGLQGARIVSISPGIIDTPMGRAEFAAERDIPAMVSGGPLARLGLPEEVADLAAYLCSPKAGFITGCDFQIDGGQVAVWQGA